MKSIFRFFLLLCLSWQAHAALVPTLLTGDVPVDICAGAACAGSSIGLSNTTRALTADPAGNIYLVFFTDNRLSVAKSVDQGASFLESVQLPVLGDGSAVVSAASIKSSSSGVIYLFSILDNGQAYVFRSLNQGLTWSDPINVGTVTSPSSGIGMATFGKYVYLMGTGSGGFQLFRSDDDGQTFAVTNVAMAVAFGNVMVDSVNGDVYIAADTPSFHVRKSTDFGVTFGAEVNPPGQAYYSSWAIAHAPGNTYLYAVGSFLGSLGDPGFKIDINANASSRLDLEHITTAQAASVFSDDFGNAVFLYRADGGGIAFQNSNDFFSTFNPQQLVSGIGSNQTAVINPQTGNIHVAYLKNGRVTMNTYGAGTIGYDVSSVPRILDFGNKLLASTTTLPVTISNNGNVPAVLSGFSVTTGFSAQSHCLASLPANASCTVDVTFVPTLPGVTASALTFTANGVALQIPLLGKVASADVSVTKTDGVTSVAAGGNLTYTITATNAGPDTALATTVTDVLPASLANVTWTCVGNAGGACTVAGTGNINDVVNLAVGGSVTYTVNAEVLLSATGTITNTVTVANAVEILDPLPANNAASDTDTVVAASFTVVGTVDPIGTGLVTCTGPVGFGGTATCSAQANPGYTLAAFSGDCAGASCTISNIQGNKSVVASFSAITYTVTGMASPIAGGTVTCTGPVGYDGTATCTALANSGYTFSAFSGDCIGASCAIANIQSNKNVVAGFTANGYTVNGVADPVAGGVVSCPATVVYNGTASCTAQANPGYAFSAFSGDCTGATCTITSIQANKNVVATFIADAYSVTGTASPTAGGSVSCTGPVAYNGTSVCTATAAPNYQLVGFTGACTGASCTVSNVQSNLSVTASFAMRQITSTSSTNAVVTAAVVSGSAACEFDPANTGPFAPPVAYEGSTAFAQGGFKFRLLNCQPGEAVQVAVTFPSLSGMGAKKYGPTPTSPGTSVWYDPAGLTISGNTLTYTVTDGGLGDDSFVADGVINDPIVPVPQAVAPVAAPTPVPTLSQWAVLALSLLMALVAGLWLRQRGGRLA